VLAAAGNHATAAEIAARVHLSEGTVRNYLSSAMRKLGARNRAEAGPDRRGQGLAVAPIERAARTAAGTDSDSDSV